ncbi:hypothetical protein NDU88_005572 [Pleurodeles waltl]|uniref:Uncharacterized protein n=1 Tax=Pleurodeles waltl TaxID=8319 RepID=A0AAV7UIH4_PLEWA|nr:hypothetical protein NDU88_005572 [Pleurodeles waltl]
MLRTDRRPQHRVSVCARGVWDGGGLRAALTGGLRSEVRRAEPEGGPRGGGSRINTQPLLPFPPSPSSIGDRRRPRSARFSPAGQNALSVMEEKRGNRRDAAGRKSRVCLLSGKQSSNTGALPLHATRCPAAKTSCPVQPAEMVGRSRRTETGASPDQRATTRGRC